MLAELPGKPDELVGEIQYLAKPGFVRIHFLIGKPVNGVYGKPHCLSNILYRTLVMQLKDSGHDRRAVASIFCVDVLYHLFPALMFKIDVYVWRLVAGGRKKPFE